MSYIAKPVSVEAWQLGGGVERPLWLQNAITAGSVTINTVDDTETATVINTNGTQTAPAHSYIIRNSYGEIYVRRADVFANEYDPIL